MENEILTGLTGCTQNHPKPVAHDPDVDDLAGRSAGTATAELDRRNDGVAHAPNPPTLPPVSPPGRVRQHTGPVRRMLLAATAGGLVGAVVASGTLLLRDDSGGSTATKRPVQQVQTSGSATAAQGEIAGILAKDVPAVVAITTNGGPGLGRSGGGAATGFVIDPNGIIVTNDHVVDSAGSVSVTTSDNRKLTARVLGEDASSDLAVLKVDATGLPTIELGDSNQVQVGDDVVAIGNALDLDGGLSATRGIVSGLHRDIPTDNGRLSGLIQTDAAINPGNSGGPLVDAQGRVIGINTAIANPTRAQNVGFVIPISKAKPIIDRLRGGE
jgi:putative serine protease PepD